MIEIGWVWSGDGGMTIKTITNSMTCWDGIAGNHSGHDAVQQDFSGLISKMKQKLTPALIKSAKETQKLKQKLKYEEKKTPNPKTKPKSTNINLKK